MYLLTVLSRVVFLTECTASCNSSVFLTDSTDYDILLELI